MAIARAKTSRLQPFSADIGVRKKPMVARGPKPSMAIVQPATMTMGADTSSDARGAAGRRVLMAIRPDRWRDET